MLQEKRMRKIVLLTLPGLIALLLNGCGITRSGLGAPLNGSGNVTTEPREVGSFTAIDIAGVGEVVITQGEAESLTVETDDNLQASVLSDVRGATLHLGMKPDVGMNSVTRMVFNVTVKDLTQITLSGAAVVSVRDLSGDNLTVDHSGAGSITAAGTVNAQRVTLSGAGSYDGAGLASDQATVDLSGLGSVVVQVRERLDATISGAGDIEYIGSPELHQQISGLGAIQQRAP